MLSIFVAVMDLAERINRVSSTRNETARIGPGWIRSITVTEKFGRYGGGIGRARVIDPGAYHPPVDIVAAAEPIKGVIFDLHATLVHGGDTGSWIGAALRRLTEDGSAEQELDAERTAALRAYLDRLWQHAHAIDPGSERDLSQERHRDVFGRTLALFPGAGPDLIAALYDQMPGQWEFYEDALPVLRELKKRGIRTVVLSNAGLDIHPLLDRTGAAELLDGVILSYEVGLVKPDPAIFAYALELLGTAGGQTLMVGDSARDDVGGAALGIRTLILPPTSGPVHGLDVVLRLTA